MSDWWLKVDRAKKHMVDINEETVRYAESHPYKFTRIRLPDSEQAIRGHFIITKQPNPMIAVMLGDFIHNLRSALDWVIVACVPRKRRYKAGFPIFFNNIFTKDADGNFMFNDSHRNFTSMIEGIHPDARTLIIDCQPFQQRNTRNVSLDIIGIISRLENADKHRQIITLGCGGQDFQLKFSIHGLDSLVAYDRPIGLGSDILYDDTIIPYKFPDGGLMRPDGSPIQPSEVDMHLVGTAKVLVEVARVGGNQPPDYFLISDILERGISNV